MDSHTGPSTGSTHKQNSHTQNTENYFKIKRGQEARCRKEGSLVQVIKRGLAILGPQQVVLISNTHTENYFKIKRGQEGLGKNEALVNQ